MNFYEAIKDRIHSPQWREVRKWHLEKEPECYVCGSTKKISVHHKICFHIAPDLELDPQNLITLCEGGKLKALNCHLLIGHLGNYRRVNTEVDIDAEIWRRKLNKRD
jgi:hypothetical protein